ncbi:MAG TPA: hypothetical protein VNI01_05160 [Elusimicrobiota bacterium]|jgi:hypothetical protein|nr:hypothetical protein [Elusimicrobiota bacterium]
MADPRTTPVCDRIAAIKLLMRILPGGAEPSDVQAWAVYRMCTGRLRAHYEALRWLPARYMSAVDEEVQLDRVLFSLGLPFAALGGVSEYAARDWGRIEADLRQERGGTPAAAPAEESAPRLQPAHRDAA